MSESLKGLISGKHRKAAASAPQQCGKAAEPSDKGWDMFQTII